MLYTLQTAAKKTFIAARSAGSSLYLTQVLSQLETSGVGVSVSFVVTHDIYVQFFSINKDANIFEELNEFLWQHSCFMRALANGTISVEPLIYRSSTTPTPLGDSDIIGALSIKKREQKYSSVVVHYSDYVATDKRETLVDGAVVDNDDAFKELRYGGQERNKIKPIFIHVWDPLLFVFARIGGQINGKDKTWTLGRTNVSATGIQKHTKYLHRLWDWWWRRHAWLEARFIIWAEMEKKTNTHVKARGYITQESVNIRGISFSRKPVMNFSARFKAVYPGAHQVSDTLGNGSGERELTIKAKYIITQQNATNLIKVCQQLYVQNNTEATITTERDFALGLRVFVKSSNAGAEFTGIIKKKKLKKTIGARRIYTYTCVAVSPVSVAKDVQGDIITELVNEEIEQNYIGYNELFKALAIDPTQGSGDISLIANVNNRAVDLRVVHPHVGYTYNFQLSDDAKTWRGLNLGDADGSSTQSASKVYFHIPDMKQDQDARTIYYRVYATKSINGTVHYDTSTPVKIVIKKISYDELAENLRVNNLDVAGDMIVSGTQTIVNTRQMLVKDPLIDLNVDERMLPQKDTYRIVKKKKFVKYQAGWNARAYHQVVIFKNKMWLLGGKNKDDTAENEIWYSDDGIIWHTPPSTLNSNDRYFQKAVVFNGKLWDFGRRYILVGPGTLHNDIWWSDDGLTWNGATSSTPWTIRSGYQVVVHDGKMWLLGGEVDYHNYQNDVWWSDDGKTWHEVTTSGTKWTGRTYHQAVAFDGKLWVLGGWDGNYKNDVWWSKDGARWYEATPAAPWSARSDCQAVVFDKKMWILGGSDASHKNDVWWSDDGKTWYEATPAAPWVVRNDHQAVAFNDKLWVLGGRHGNKYKNDIWSSKDGKTWTDDYEVEVVTREKIPPPPPSKADAGVSVSTDIVMPEYHTYDANFGSRIDYDVIVFNDELYVLGGNVDFISR